MTQKIVFYYGPKSGFRRHLPKRLPITTISELAIYSDRKMREHTFKIQSARRGAENPEKEAERLQVPCLVAFSEQYASISESAINSFLSFIGQFDVGSIYLQNPPMHVVSQFESLHSRVKTIRYDYRTLDFDCLRRINREYDGVIIGQPEVKEKLLKALYPLASGSSEKPAVLLFYGPTGVGKSETAKYLSDVMGQTLLRRQFSMFHSNEFSSYLFGGRHTGNCLAKDLMERESNVILFDEFDKPNPVFHSAFYQVFDEGIYEDRNYRADARRALIICTSNYASAEEARERLGAPIFARFDSVIEFKPLSEETQREILRKRIREAAAALSDEERKHVDEEAVAASLAGTLDGENGARGIEHAVKDKISEELLKWALAE